MKKELEKSRQTALILCFLFGTLGAHRFYVGRNISASIQLFFTILLVSTNINIQVFSVVFLWVLFDLVGILTNKFDVKFKI